MKGILKGYDGLMNEEIIDLSAKMCPIPSRGAAPFCIQLAARRCAPRKVCSRRRLPAVNSHRRSGSHRRRRFLCRSAEAGEPGINTIGVPGTMTWISPAPIYHRLDTAVNTAMEAIDKVRDTSTSHERCSIIEVMGRNAGYIALWCGIANGAEDILPSGKI